MEFTKEQMEVVNDLVMFIKGHGIEVNTPADLKNAFLEYLKGGSAAYFYFNSDEHEQREFIRKLGL